ncbi:MAG TPA: hypothetical protein VFY04_07075 [Solirubrobacterales bacterium]|nr:hypothetical protein [Solirubrobacterales bacterium]
MNSPNRIARRAALILGLCALSLGLAAAPALAAPALEVQLTRYSPEIQKVEVRGASGGQYRLIFDTGPDGPGVSETTDLKFDANNAEIEAALEALTNVSGADGSVTLSGNSVGSPIVIFDSGPLLGADVPLLRGVDGTTSLTGPGARVVTRTVYLPGVSRSDKRLDYVANVRNSGDAPIGAGTATTVEVDLPAGLGTSVLRTAGTGWTCTTAAATPSEPAQASCSREDALAPGASYPRLVVSARLGADAPDHAVATATATAPGAAPGSDDDQLDFGPARPFGFQNFDSEVIDAGGEDFKQAGGHPFSAGVGFDFNVRRGLSSAQGMDFAQDDSIEAPRQVKLDLPRGLVANALAVPTLCAGVADVIASTCPAGSAVGLIDVDIHDGIFANSTASMPIFAIEPERGLPAQFAFAHTTALNNVFTISPRLRPEDGYAISLDASPSTVSIELRSLHQGLFCGFGAKVTGNTFEGCREASDPQANPLPLVTNPTRCTGAPPTVKVSADSWEHPGSFVSAEAVDPLPENCEAVDFQPEFSIVPTNNQADTPTGVEVEIEMPTGGLESKTGRAQANLNNAVVTLPQGMALNPAASHGLSSCTPAQVKLGSNADPECPLSSQVGTIEIDTPLIRETLKGHAFLASQRDNPFKSTLGLYLVFSSEKDGITIKVAGKLETDPQTGRITSSFVENPEAPFSRLSLKFNSGPRAPLINPPRCGTYAIRSELSPWSAASPANPTKEEIVADDHVYQVTSGPNGGPCPEGALDPSFDAGLKNAVAGSKSPFVLKLSRADGSERLTGLDLTMPKGLVAYLKGVASCPEHVLAGISTAELTGRGELSSPACPAASQIGTVQAGAGAGPYPFYAPGRAYLAGPYKGAPLSIAVVTPAVAGPFDLGNVVVRNAVHVDRKTARVSVVSDPIPTILHGILLDVRDVRVNIDREGFTAAPTGCERQSVEAQISGQGGGSVNRSVPFGLGDCAALGFKPKLDLRLFGGTKRGAHPRLRATLTARAGDANIAGTAVTLPRSEFLDQANIRTICTRVQFAAGQGGGANCPAASVYGHATAITPLLDGPVTGPVYLRSSDNKLPDLVAALRGPDRQPIEAELVGRVDSIRGGIRTTFEGVPDVPVTKFTLTMQGGGKKGLLVNSRNICAGANRARIEMDAQNGRQITLRPKLKATCGKARKAKKRRGGAKGR